MQARRLILMAACLMLSQIAISSVRPMTSYRILALGSSPVAIGWLSALYAIAPAILAIPLGRRAGRGQAAWLGVIGSGFFFGGCVGLALGVEIWHLAVASVALGAGNLGQMIAYQSIIAAESHDGAYDRDYGWYAAGASMGQLVGPLFGTVAFEHYGGGLPGTTAANLGGATAALIGLGFSATLLRGKSGQKRAAEPAATPTRAIEVLRYPGALASVYVSLVVLSAIDLLSVYLPVLGEEKGWAATYVGILLVVRATFSLMARLVLGLWSDNASRRTILLSTVGMTAVMCALIPIIGQPSLLMLVMALLGLAMGVGQPVSLAWTVATVPANARPTAIAVRLMGNRIGQVLLPAASATFVAVGGAASAFWMLGILLASSAGAVAMSK